MLFDLGKFATPPAPPLRPVEVTSELRQNGLNLATSFRVGLGRLVFGFGSNSEHGALLAHYVGPDGEAYTMAFGSRSLAPTFGMQIGLFLLGKVVDWIISAA